MPAGGPRTLGDANGPGNYGNYDPRQWGREYQQLLNDINEIRNNLGRNDPLSNDLGQVASQLQQMIRDPRVGDPTVIERMAQQIIDPLKSVELELSRALELLLAKENIRSAQEDEIPLGYGKVVEEYYKKLSATPK
jgi:hypothetical protein